MDRQGRIGRELAGAVLLVGLLFFGLLTAWDMGRTHSDISRKIEDASWYALTEDWESARLAAESARSQWEDHRKLSSMLADHTPMEEIESLFARVYICSAARDTVEFAASCAELSQKLLAMGEAHRLTWENLL